MFSYQLYSSRNFPPMSRTFEMVSKAGYTAVEGYGALYAEAKARAVAAQYPDALVIGSDQVAFLGKQTFGKPGSHDNAVRQLRIMRGHTVNFFTGLCVLNAKTSVAHLRGVPTLVTFRDLSDEEIENYLQREKPYNCAGSAKSEGLGIALIDRMEGDDPNALIGLPLIALCDLLLQEDVRIL